MEKLDLTKILKDCPSGMELYSPIYGTVVFERVNEGRDFSIETNKCVFTANGRYCSNGECVLFPSKDQRDWSKWQKPFVDGDVIYVNDTIGIIKENGDPVKMHAIFLEEDESWVRGCNIRLANTMKIRRATEEEKQRLFDEIKKNGYEWDAEKKELKKIEPKFDISTLQPFDKVLVRSGDSAEWSIDFFERRMGRYFRCHVMFEDQCVPYNKETKHLLGTTLQAPDKYITWE